MTMIVSSDAVRNAADRDAKSGTLVEVFGTYQQVALAKAPGARPEGAAVLLEDGTMIHLEPPWHPDAVRPADEIAEYDGRAVVVKGLLFGQCPPPPDGRAYLVVPCIAFGPIVMSLDVWKLLNTGELE